MLTCFVVRLAALAARWGSLNAAATFRGDCLRHAKHGGCEEWFGPARAPATTERTVDNLHGATSLYENYEKMLIYWLLLSNVTYCENDRCDTWGQMRAATSNGGGRGSGGSPYARFVLRQSSRSNPSRARRL